MLMSKDAACPLCERVQFTPAQAYRAQGTEHFPPLLSRAVGTDLSVFHTNMHKGDEMRISRVLSQWHGPLLPHIRQSPKLT